MSGPSRYSVGYDSSFLAEREPRAEQLRRYVSTTHLHHRAALRAKVLPSNATSLHCQSAPNLAIGSDMGGISGRQFEQLGGGKPSTLMMAGRTLAKPRTLPPQVIFMLGGPGSGIEEITSRLAATFVGVVHLPHSGNTPSGIVSLLKKQIEEAPSASFLVDGFPSCIGEYDEWVHQMGGQVDDFAIFLDISRETLLGRLEPGYQVAEAFNQYDRLLPVVAALKRMGKLRPVMADAPQQFENIYEECEYAVVQLIRPRNITSHPLAGARFNANATCKAPFHRAQVPLSAGITSPYASPKSKAEASGRELYIFHFNDVYNIDECQGDICGGVARFLRAVEDFRQKHPQSLVIFSGDGFSPSILSTITRGKHMIKALNALGIDCAVYGNHDFDFGLKELEDLSKMCNFPWLLSNVWYRPTDTLLADGLEYKIFVVSGLRVGCIGVVEEDWLVTLSAVEAQDCIYEDFVATSRRLARKLKSSPHNCDVVIALTHMRVPNDERLCQECDEIDLVLGGHDHHYEVREIPPFNTLMVKSGTDFRQATEVRLCVSRSGVTATWTRRDIRKNLMPHPTLARFVDECMETMNAALSTVMGHSLVDLDGRFSIIRTQESNLGNFIADSVRGALRVDTVIINSGTIRSDQITPAGNITTKDIMTWLPINSELTVLELSGSQLLRAIEAGVSAYPKMEGRFPQSSGLTIWFDPKRPAFQRVTKVNVQRWTTGEFAPLDPHATYTFAATAYLCSGKDGYDVLQTGRVIRSPELCGVLPLHVKNYFAMLKHCSAMTRNNDKHTATVVRAMRKFAEMQPGKMAPQAGSIGSISPIVQGRIVTV